MSAPSNSLPTAKRSFLPLVLWLAIAPLVFLLPLLSAGKVVGAFDQLAPTVGSQDLPAQAWDVLQADGVLQFYTWRDLVLESHRNGQLPALNPYQFAGQPLLANSQSAALYPPHVLLGKLGLPSGAAVNLLAWFHLFWAGLGVALIVRRLAPEGPGEYAIAAGISFSLSNFLASWLGLGSVPSTVGWIPWILLGLLALKAGESIKERLFATAAIAICSGMMLMAGHLQFSAYGFMAAFCVLLWVAIDERCAVRLGLGLVAFALGAGLSMPQLMPTLEFSKLSHRRNVPTEEGFAAYQGGALAPMDAGGLLAPKLYGDPTQRFGEDPTGISTYWPPFLKRGGNWAESAITLGPLVLGLLFLLRRSSSRVAVPGVILMALGLLLAFGSPLGRLLYFSFPGWSSTGSPGRAIVLLVMGGCIAAGVAGAMARFELKNMATRMGLGLGALLALSVVGSRLMANGTPWIPGSEEVFASIVAATPPTAILIALIGCVLAAGVVIGRDKLPENLRPHLLPLVALLLPILLLPPVRGGEPLKNPMPAPAERVAIVNEPWDLLGRAPAFMPPNLATQFRIQELGAYDSLLNREQVAVLNAINGQDSAPSANGNIMFVKPSADPAKLALAGVTEVWSRRPLEGFGEATEDGFFLRYRLDGTGVVTAEGGQATVSRLSSESIELTLEGAPSKVLLRFWAHEGWSAWDASGKALELAVKEEPIAEGVVAKWIEVPVSGAGKVTLTYTPPGFQTGTRIGLIAMLLVGILVVWAWPRNRQLA